MGGLPSEARGMQSAFAKASADILRSLRERRMVGATRIELVTPAMSTRRARRKS